MDRQFLSTMFKTNLEAAREELTAVLGALDTGLQDLENHGILAAMGGLLDEPERIARVERLLKVSLEITQRARP